MDLRSYFSCKDIRKTADSNKVTNAKTLKRKHNQLNSGCVELFLSDDDSDVESPIPQAIRKELTSNGKGIKRRKQSETVGSSMSTNKDNIRKDNAIKATHLSTEPKLTSISVNDFFAVNTKTKTESKSQQIKSPKKVKYTNIEVEENTKMETKRQQIKSPKKAKYTNIEVEENTKTETKRQQIKSPKKAKYTNIEGEENTKAETKRQQIKSPKKAKYTNIEGEENTKAETKRQQIKSPKKAKYSIIESEEHSDTEFLSELEKTNSNDITESGTSSTISSLSKTSSSIPFNATLRRSPRKQQFDVVEVQELVCNSNSRNRDSPSKGFIEKCRISNKCQNNVFGQLPRKRKLENECTRNVNDNLIKNFGENDETIKRTCVIQRPSDSSLSGKSSELLVEKYRPKTLKQLVGQQGDKSPANKLLRWLQFWHKNCFGPEAKKPTKNGYFASGSGDGSGFKAVLLSGPPGIGKTTTAQLVCNDLNWSFTEMNASDQRNKKVLEFSAAEAVDNKSLDTYMKELSLSPSKSFDKHVLIMDEIDGMSGNEDRGGMQEVIALIKKTRIPIICICNDRQHPKIRSLANYCFDLRFPRPRIDQIRSPMMSIAFKEGLKISGNVMDQLIESTNHDIRQMLHQLYVISAESDKSKIIDVTKTQSDQIQKNVSSNPFETTRLMFSNDSAKMSLNDKADVFFFVDYSLMPLFVQENYINAQSGLIKNASDHLKLLHQASDLIAIGDLVENQIRKSGAWHLLPTQAMLSCVCPSDILRGHLKGMAQFPSWLGQNSKRNKAQRLLSMLHMHTSLSTDADVRDICLDYVPALNERIFRPLLNGDERAALDCLLAYNLMKDDLETITELNRWPEGFDLWSKINSKTKAALTRSYNKSAHAMPYDVGLPSGGSGGRKRLGRVNDDLLQGTVDEEGNVIEDSEQFQQSSDDEGGKSNEIIKPIEKRINAKARGKGKKK